MSEDTERTRNGTKGGDLPWVEAGKRTGRVEGREEGFREGKAIGLTEGLAQGRAEIATAVDPSLLPQIRLAAYDAGYAAGSKDARVDAKAESDAVLAQEHTRGYLQGCEEEHRRWVHKEIEERSHLDDLRFWEGFNAGQQHPNALNMPSARRLVEVETQTDAPVPIVYVDAHVQTPAPSMRVDAVSQATPARDNPSNIPGPTVDNSPSMHFSWADEADSLPVHSAPPLLPAPRDFSVLRSSSKSPFGSLQCRARRSHRTRSFVPRPHIPWPAPPSVPIVTRHHPAGLRAGQPSILQVSSPPSGFAVPPSPLSWHGDPRLVELSRVLRSLGWVRESSS
ncbi:hypothetical protein EWM64_g8952 [Hericium alpestre]|uniref:Essential protein Yae1 N-terminal domain-containing protein n=1 Tax=Hericium alpestre TaxID=135208 RepID=A0A4Y9ZLC4_9AGAM|nr:hypothetical protein EWM64_g8952 [Hericium alpestre]